MCWPSARGWKRARAGIAGPLRTRAPAGMEQLHQAANANDAQRLTTSADEVATTKSEGGAGNARTGTGPPTAGSHPL
eukprot:4965638-Alexandrium_andersonii.AAC.1